MGVAKVVCPICKMDCITITEQMSLSDRLHHHNRTVHGCEACLGRGWLLMDNSDHGLRIERCDSCEKYESDEAAVQAVVSMAEDVLQATWSMNNRVKVQ